MELNEEDLQKREDNNSEAQLDIRTLNFWRTGQKVIVDIRVFNLFAQRHRK